MVELFTKALHKALKEFSPDEVLWRLHFIVGGLIHLLTHSGFLYRVAGSLTGTPSMDSNIERFLDFAVAGLRDGLPSDEGGEEAGEQKKKAPQAQFNF